MTITLVLAEDSFLVREGVTRMIGASADIEVLAACDDLDSALRTIDELVPDVVLTDIRMPPSHSDEGLRIAQHCRTKHAGMGVLLLSQYIEPGYVKQLLTQGTEGRGYLLKERVGISTSSPMPSGRSPPDVRPSTRRSSSRSSGAKPGPATPTSPGSARASARCWPQSPRAGPTPRYRAVW